MKSDRDNRRAIVLAGGKGTRLAPYTATFPKPLVPVGDMPIAEVLLRRLRHFGIRRVTLAVNHLAALIQSYFGDGKRFGIEIDYAFEETPLGTAGPLRGISGLDAPFLVVNGDLLTDLDFSQLLDAHESSDASLTVATYERVLKSDFGVIEVTPGGNISGYQEKPEYRHLVSMGAYVVEPRALDRIPPGERFDLPDLVQSLLLAQEPIHAYRHIGYWLDIGRPDDYRQAQEDFLRLRDDWGLE